MMYIQLYLIWSKLIIACSLQLENINSTWAEFKNIVTQTHHRFPPYLTKLKEYKKLKYPDQVE